MKRLASWSLVLCFLMAASARAAAQGEQTGLVTGRVTTSADGQALAGVTVTVSSPALLGVRTTTSDINGVYLVRNLPPGEYTMAFELAGLSRQQKVARVPLGGTATVDTGMTIVVEETVQVTAVAQPALLQPRTSQNFVQSETVVLPVGRSPFLIADLAAGLTDNTPNANQVTVSGGFAYDNVWLINGVDVNDNVLGSSNNLFVEEAIGEVQVLTSGISAEYGRFSGGVVNVITRSGGNSFSGGFRLNLSNPAWSVETPFETTQRVGKLSKVHEGIIGGPLVKDQLWFFGAGRWERSSTQGAFPQTAAPLVTETDNNRYELKLTGSVSPGHTLRGSFVDNDLTTGQASLPFSIDPRAYVHPHTPNRLFVANYAGVVGTRLLATAQYSQKHWGVRNNGNTSTNIVDSPFLTRTGTMYQYNAPYFDSTDPEDRNNRQTTASLAYFVSTPGLGSHDVKGGIEQFTSTRVGGNSQTSTGYVFLADFAVGPAGAPVLDANGRIIPRFVPGSTRLQTWMPVRGAQIDVSTTSLYLQDRITAGRHLSFDLGFRYEHVTSDATAVSNGIEVNTIVPRLGASYDPVGDGRMAMYATYGHYAGKYSDVQFARNSNVGNADRYTTTYTGPAGQGLDFAPGFSPANYSVLVSGTFPRDNVRFADDLSSPLTREFTLGIGRQLTKKAHARVTYVRRDATNLVEDVIRIENGKTTVVRDGATFGTFDNIVWENSNAPTRQYQGLEMQTGYQITDDLHIWGDWTIQLQNDGTFEGEGASTPAIGSPEGDYPELLVAGRNFPSGRLDDFQRHRVRLWGVYRLGLNRYGSVDIAPLWRVNSGRTYSLVANGAALSAIQLSHNPGYAGVPTQQLFFDERGSEAFEGYGLFDVALTYSVPVWQTLAPWMKFEVLNTFNNQKLISWDTTVAPDNAGPKDENGLALNYVQGARFGQAVRPADYPRPRPGIDGGRTFLMSMGVRF
ncbi:MAG TPA: TonB-dependent receptor [Vicinamibacterales bacterium]